MIEGSNNKELQKNQFSSPSFNQSKPYIYNKIIYITIEYNIYVLDKTHSKIESPSKNNQKIKSPIRITPQLLGVYLIYIKCL